MKKKIIASVACALAALSMIGCDTGTEKIMQGTDYSARHASKTLSIKSFKNEYESAQIVLTPNGDVESYTVQTADLKNAQGEVLPASAFTLYNQKYVEVTTLKDLNISTGTGFYPDALLPMDAAIKAGENCVADGDNQGIWVTVNPSEEQPSGFYTGEFTVTADGKTYKVPVNVTVYDYSLSDEVHTKTSFAIEWFQMAKGEMDSTIEMQEAYYEFLLDYRISPQNFPGTSMHNVTLTDDETLPEFLAYAHKYTLDPRCTSFNLPFECHPITTVLKDGTTKSITVPYFDQLEKLIRDMAAYSFENKVNLFKKAQTYFIIYDEYDGNGTVHGANYTLTKTYELYDQIAEDLDQTVACDDAEFKAEVIHSIANIKDKLVGNLTDSLDVPAAQMVPEVMYIHTEDARQRYENFAKKSYGEEAELWTYTCCFPLNPYPTYHTEDALVSSRLLNWIMYKYYIVGNLYWTTTLNTWRELKNGKVSGDKQLQDFYYTALRFPSANGDGLLMYPGRPYDIYGPVPTIRLASIRDGQEDYDLLYALEQYYLERGLTGEDFDTVYNILNESLFSGTAVRHSDALIGNFADSRAAIASLLEAASGAGAIVENISLKEGLANVQLSAPESTVLTRNGQTLTGTTVDGITSYSLSIPMTEEVNRLAVFATANGKTYEMDMRLGGRSTLVQGAEFADFVKFETGGSTSTETVEGMQAMVLDYASTVGTDFETLNALSATVDVRTFDITKAINRITINVYSYVDAPIKLRIFGKGNGSNTFDGSTEVLLEKGWNEFVVSTASFNVKDKLEYLRFYVEGTAATKLAVGKVTIAG